MVCGHCGADNRDGRENCAVCGRPLININAVIDRDRRVGRIVKVAVIGVFAGGALGMLAGAALGALLTREGPIAGAIVGAWVGLWIGVPCGTIIGAIIGALIPAPKQY